MKFFTVLLFTAAASAAALPIPATEAEVESMRARGVSEAEIAHSFPLAHTLPSLLKRKIDADAEVAPGAYAAPSPLIRREDRAAAAAAADAAAAAAAGHADIDPSTPHGRVVVDHVEAVEHFISDMLEGKLGRIAAGTGGEALRRKMKARSVAAGEERGDGAELQRPERWVYRW